MSAFQFIPFRKKNAQLQVYCTYYIYVPIHIISSKEREQLTRMLFTDHFNFSTKFWQVQFMNPKVAVSRDNFLHFL